MNNMYFAKVLSAISNLMPCEKCPDQCSLPNRCTQANCDRHWYEILTRLDSNTKWEDISNELFENYKMR